MWLQGIVEQTLYRWKAKYGGMEVSDAKKLRQLEEENRKLKSVVAELRWTPMVGQIWAGLRRIGGVESQNRILQRSWLDWGCASGSRPVRAHGRSDGLASKQSAVDQPSGTTGGFFVWFECIDLVKLPSEAVGCEREDSRAAAHLILLWGRRFQYRSAGVR
jgi:hypothetical protein